MVATLYTADETHIVNPGVYTHEYIRQISSGNFDGTITKVSLQRNTIALLSQSVAPNGTRGDVVILGPTEYVVPTGFVIRSFRVDRYRDSDWGDGAQVTAYDNYNQQGAYKTLLLGEYDMARLAQREDGKMGITTVRSMVLGRNTLAILYGADQSMYLVGPRAIDDVARYINDLERIVVYSVDTVPTNLKDSPVGYTEPLKGPDIGAFDVMWTNAAEQHRSREFKLPDRMRYGSTYHVLAGHKKKHHIPDESELSTRSEFGPNYYRVMFWVVLTILAIYIAMHQLTTPSRQSVVPMERMAESYQSA